MLEFCQKFAKFFRKFNVAIFFCVGDALVAPCPALASEANYSKNPLAKSIIFRSFLAPSPALASEANYSKNPSVKSIIFRSFLGSSKGRCSALHSEACCSKKPLTKIDHFSAHRLPPQGALHSLSELNNQNPRRSLPRPAGGLIGRGRSARRPAGLVF